MATELRDRLQEALGGVYVLERELGGAGMSRVFVARDDALGRRIVVKVLPPEMAAAVNVERFRREIQLAASLLHPHIIPLLSAGETLGIPYFTMPYVEGESLRARVRRDGALPVAEAVRLACEVARALDYAHRRGVVHRDIKPDNVLAHDGHALVTDFGIARAISAAATGPALTIVGMAIGTPAYMSPEQGAGELEIDGRTDIYALGCVLYEMLTGRTPFGGMGAEAMAMMHQNAPVPSVRAMRADVPLGVDRAVARALAKGPGERFASAADFAAALEESRVATAATTPRSSMTAVGATLSSIRSARRFIAVLPFANMSPDPENEYFSDGITEDITAQLTKIRGLRVMSRTSMMRYKKRPDSIPEMGRELGVSHVLEGSVRRAGSRLRIVAQLIDASSDEHLWAETWDRDMTDVFAIQSEVAECIAHCLHARLSTAERSRLFRKPTEDIEAYNLYLLGRHHYAKVSASDFDLAVGFFRQAIARDPHFARAYGALAEAMMYRGNGYWGVRPHDTFPEGFAMASRALELDPDSAEAHAFLSLYHDWYRYQWDEGGREIERAVELNPSSPMIRLYYAMHLCAVGRFDDAVAHRDTACQLDPSAMVIRGNATWILYLAGRMEQALAECRSLRQMEPTSAYGAFSHGLVAARAGVPEEAVAAFRDGVVLSGRASLYLVMLAYACAVVGEHDEARSILAELATRAETEFVWPMGLAFAHAHLGEEGVALDHLERAYEERVGWMLMIGREPALDVLRGTARFEALARKIGPG
jgi:serine/threonine-protein kinase